MRPLILSKIITAAIAFISSIIMVHAQSIGLESRPDSVSSLEKSKINSNGDSHSSGITGFGVVKTDLLLTKKITNGIQLEWVSENDINTKAFEIERSNDGNNFKKIRSIAFQNTRTKNTYSYFDEHPLPVNYYRLKMIDEDGKFTYSKVIVINQKGSWYSAILPNPFVQSFSVQVYLPSSETLKVQLLDMNGRLIRYKSIMGIAGTNNLEFNDIGNLQSGLYLVRIIRTESVIEQKIIKTTP